MEAVCHLGMGHWFLRNLRGGWQWVGGMGLVVSAMTFPLIQVANLSFAYPNSPPILRQIDLIVQPHERVGLAGGNGAGKSTLLLCLAGVMPIGRGQVRVDGLDPTIAAERQQLPARLGLLFQNSDDQLIHATVADDVAFGPLNLNVPVPEVAQRVESALAQVNLTHCRDRSPHRLSNGEKRRAALAGLLAMHPKILLLDEPTSDLDVRGKNELVQLLQQLSMTMMIASHDLDLIQRTCHRLIVLDQGRIVADGPVDEIVSDARLLAAHGLA
jgi:cobalt/nickel transport system ATP-binding protein